MSYQNRAGRSQRSYTVYSSGNRRRNNSRKTGNKKYIDPARFVQVATITEQEVYEPTHRFTDFALNDLLLRNLTAKGYEAPSPIQDQTIPAALTGQDIIGIAGTGTGKTAAFALPALNKLISDPNSRALVIAPTRELAEQIEQECRALARGSKLYGALLIGGTNMSGQLRDLRAKPQIVIGTPGRIKDHIDRRSLDLSGFNITVLDEVDRMLDMGFVDDVTTILSNTNPVQQSMFFSATMEPRVRKLIEDFSNNPHVISIKASSASESVHQDVVRYRASAEKLEKLHDLLNDETIVKAIIFDETQRSVERLENELRGRGFSVASLHGGKSQGQRKRALSSFKKSEVSVLVATDVAARGIDISDISHVVNYAVPNDYDDYVHRIGRAGRAGRTGHAFTFIPA